MGRRVWVLCSLLLAVAAVEFAALTGAFARIDLSGSAQPAYAGVPVSTSTPTATPTDSTETLPTGTPTPTFTPTSTPFSPPTPPPNDGTGSISGTIVNGQNTPIAGATVWVLPAVCCVGPTISTTTDGTGAYTAEGLGTGQWQVSAEATGFPYRYYDNTYDYYAAQPVSVTDGVNTPGINIQLLAEANITGTVTNALGTPIAGAFVSADQYECCGWGNSAFSLDDGSYDIGGLPPGAYRVRASAPGFAPEYYDNTYDNALAASVPLTDGGTTPNINFALVKGALITGRIMNTQGTPIADASVNADSAVCCIGGYDSSDANGYYGVVDLPAGSYRLYVSADGYIGEYYNNASAYDDATLIPLAPGGSATGFDVTLSSGGSISGVVRDSAANPIAGAEVYASPASCCDSGGFATSGADGTYHITTLAPGDYRVSATASGHVGQFFDGASNYINATLVNVSGEDDTPAVDFSLAQEAIINGFVRDEGGQPIQGAYVSASSDVCCAPSVQSEADGSYHLTGLPAMNAIVYASAQGYLSEWYNNSSTYDGATAIPITAGSTTNGINFSLTLGGSISGVVLDDAQQPIADASVNIQRDCCYGYGINTDANGAYSVVGLPPGDYVVQAGGAGYVGEYYDGVSDYDAATTITLALSEQRGGIDFHLALGGHITGTVTDGNGQPLSNVSVDADDVDECCSFGLSGADSTDSNGHYDIGGLAPGEFRVRADKQGYVTEYYDNQADWAAAVPVLVTGAATTAGIDFALAEGSHITGTVRDAANQPVAGAAVSAQADCCGDGSYGYAYTDENGAYDVHSLASGTFIVRVQKQGFASEYYNNKYTFFDADEVVVGEATTVPGINFTLDVGGSVSGTVLDIDAQPVAEAWIELRLQPGGDVVTSTGSASDGTYSVADLPPGDYKVSAAKYPGYITEFYNNVEDVTAATAVHVASGAAVTNIDFSLRPPNPDKFRETLDFSSVFYTNSMSTSGFGLDPSETQPCGNVGATAWFKQLTQVYPPLLPIDAPADQVSVPGGTILMQADTGGSNFDTVLAVYDDPDPSPPANPAGITELLECNDDAPGGSQSVLGTALAAGQSKVTWNAIPGHAYLIQAGGKGGATGNLVLNVGCPGDGDCDAQSNAADNCPAVWNYDQTNTDSDEITTPGVTPHDTSRPNGDAAGDFCDPDIDNDGLSNDDEGGPGAVSPPSGPCGASTDPYKPDTDGDGVIDGAECALGSNPNDRTSKPVAGAPDSDGDGLSDVFEGIIGSDPAKVDTDADGVVDPYEYKGYGTSLTNADTDGDGCSDGREVASVDGLVAVNSIDLQLVAQAFLKNVFGGGLWTFDVNRDGAINSLDLQLVAQNFAPGGC